MNHISLALLLQLIMFSNLVGQNYFVVDYTFTDKSSEFMHMQLNETLFANNAKARLILYPPNLNKNERFEVSENDVFLVKPNTTNGATHYFFDAKLNEIYVLIENPKGKQIVIDDGVQFNWVVTNETKKMNEFEVVKATTSFRGRNYVVWFDPSIPIPYGPWKFYGLPGLILQVYDDEDTFLWEYSKISTPVQIQEGFVEFSINDYDKESIQTAEEFTNQLKEDFNKRQKSMFSKLPRGGRVESVTNPFEKAIERIYEWEEEN